MLNTTGPTLCIIVSPFQCLCMLEALKYFNITNYDVLIGYSDELSLDKIGCLLRNENISYSQLKIAHIIKDILPAKRIINKRYTNFIIGDFENYNGYCLACLLAARNATICYVDDGAQAYRYFGNPPIRKHLKFSVRSVIRGYSLMGFIKGMKKPAYFTIYDVESIENTIIRNNMTLLRSNKNAIQKGVFIIGTNSSTLELKGYTYFDYLERILDWVGTNYGSQPILFCPHRRDLNNEKVLPFCKANGIEIYNTEVSVEYDFVKKSLYPKVIIGFNSNALYTLHQIYPESDCRTVRFHLIDPEKDRRACLLSQKMQEKGICVLDLY